MEVLKQNPDIAVALIASLLINVFEQIVPHLPTKANSTIQVIIQVAKAIIKKKTS